MKYKVGDFIKRTYKLPNKITIYKVIASYVKNELQRYDVEVVYDEEWHEMTYPIGCVFTQQTFNDSVERKMSEREVMPYLI